mmetsp:Transcript_47287/g.60756  ORF Transcript_47287/g.60756 Transcript_47287/m.60756 type:complete len:403 (-) Transcript_47287:188-1396(-)
MRGLSCQLCLLSLLSEPISFVYSEIQSTNPAPLYLLGEADSNAKCLDGSPGAYYHRKALNESFATKWVFSLQGGGECVDETSCADRATGDLGSSLNYASDGSDNLSQFQDGDEDHNPDFFGWNHVFVMYCTGDLFLGTVIEPGDNQWGWAYFSGAIIVDAVIKDLKIRADLPNDYNLSNADTVIWSGDSAGGIGAGASLDFAAALIPDAKVVGAPIAGFYWNNSVPYTGEGAIDYIPFDVDSFAAYWDMWEMRVPVTCAAVFSSAPWTCGFLNFSLPHLNSDIFVIEMLVDSVQLYLHSGVAEYDDNTAPYVTMFGQTMTTALTTATVDGTGPRTGLFAPSCFEHTSFYYDGPFLQDSSSGGKNISFVSAFGDWLLRHELETPYHFDDCCSQGDYVIFNPTC